MSTAPVFLVVEPANAIRSRIGAWLENIFPGYRILLASDAEEALRLITTERPSIVLVEMYLPDGNGFDLVRKIRATLPITRIFVMSFQDSRSFRGESLMAGADGFIPKHQLYADLLPLIEDKESE